MGITPIERIKLAWLRLRHGIPAGQSAECTYGNTPGAWENCAITVAPYEGYRDGRMVFCSDEHAALDQSEQAM